MKIRCDLHLNGGSRKLVLVAGQSETVEHLALKLSAYLLFWKEQPILEASPKHPALMGQEFTPDLMALDETGSIKLWIECGQVTLHKLSKLIRRLPAARIVVIKPSERAAQRLRQDLSEELRRSHRVEVFGWPEPEFRHWLGALGEKTEIYGESGGLMINAVVNETPMLAELKCFR
ncbi:MAG: YaeQ family protein [Elusimicrobia bacterium]|nr:YaeQ family protein [Elusimicrobiota bacterium]